MGKVTGKRKLERFYFLLFREWEILRRRSNYRSAFRKFQKQRKPDIVSALKEFRDKFHISPIDPLLSFNEVLDRWLKNTRPGSGYRLRPFPLESVYRNGDRNFPTFAVKGFPHPKVAVVDISRNAYVSDILSSIDSFLDHKKLKGTKAKSFNPPFKMPPQILKNGDIQVYLNLESTKKRIKNDVKKILKSEGFQDGLRKESIKRFQRQMAIFDKKKENRHISFTKLAQAERLLYPKKSIFEIAKILSDDYNDAVRLINPGKKKKHGKKDLRLKGFKDYPLSYIGSDYTKIETVRSKKKTKGQKVTKRKGNIIYEKEEKSEDINLNQFYDKREAIKMSPVKTLTIEEYLKKLTSP